MVILLEIWSKFAEHLFWRRRLGTVSVLSFTGFAFLSQWKISVLSFCMIINFSTKIFFIWWIISTVICGSARIMKIRWGVIGEINLEVILKFGKFYHSVTRIGVLNDHVTRACDTMVIACDTVCVSYAMFRCKLCIVSLKVLSWY